MTPLIIQLISKISSQPTPSKASCTRYRATNNTATPRGAFWKDCATGRAASQLLNVGQSVEFCAYTGTNSGALITFTVLGSC